MLKDYLDIFYSIFSLENVFRYYKTVLFKHSVIPAILGDPAFMSISKKMQQSCSPCRPSYSHITTR